MNGTRVRRAAGFLAVACLLGAACPLDVSAGTTGSLSGLVKSTDGAPIVAVTVVLVGTRLGAYTDEEGRYTILNVSPGSYEVKLTRLGYETKVVREVGISADQVTPLDVELGEQTVQMEEVVVTARRPPVDLNVTSTKVTLSEKEIESLPVQELEDVVNLQAGVVDGHFRGGREGEVQWQVDGVSVNNAFNNTSSLRVDRSLLQEVQVISGTFDAEYGQAMSGVVNAVLKDGTEELEYGGEVYLGDYVFSKDRRLTPDVTDLKAVQSYQANLSGPLPLPGTTFLVSGRRFLRDGYLTGTRTFVPTDSSDFEKRVLDPHGDGERVPLGYTREWSGVAKLTNSSIPNVTLNYQAIFNSIDSRRADFAFRLNPDGLSTQEQFAISHGLDWTHTLSKSTFYDVSLRQNYFDYEDKVYDDFYDPRYDDAGPPKRMEEYELGAYVQGVQFTRYLQRTNTLLFKGSVTSQLDAVHQMKAGGELSRSRVEFGTTGYFNYVESDEGEQLRRYVDDPPDYPGPADYDPIAAAAFVQDQANWSDFKLRAGLRLEYFDARATVPSDLANPANAIEGAPESTDEPTSTKVRLAPRLGVAYPMGDDAAVHFAYGHFYQFPPLGQIFSNADYSNLADVQAGEERFGGVMGNPDIKPERTVQYEFGYKHSLTPDLGVDFTVFFKDIRDLLGVEFISTYNDAEYARFTNVDFGSVKGFTVALDHRRLGPASVSLDYTWQLAEGNSSDPRETAVRAAANEDPRPRVIPFNWDQRHTLNMTVTVADPDDYTVSAVLRLVSGQPYTPVIESGFGGGLDANSGRKPTGGVLDLRAEKTVPFEGMDLRVFSRVFNLFDATYFNGAVFPSTGSPNYSRFPTDDREALADPTRYYEPRRIEFGIALAPGGAR